MTHFESVGVNVLYQKSQILVNAALVDQFKVFMTFFQQRNDRVNDCHVLPEYDAIINIRKNDAVLPKEDTFINLTLNKVTIDESFAKLLKPVVASLLETIKALVKL